MKVETKLEQSFKQLALEYNIERFSDRKRLQKITYLLEIFGVDFGFKFNWYLHGPYSPALTDVLYKNDKESVGREVPDSKDDQKKIESLKRFLGSDIKSSHTLELIVSLHYLMVIGRAQGKSDKEILELLNELKPFFTDEEVTYHYKKVKELIENPKR